MPGGTGMRVFPGNGDGSYSCVFEVPSDQSLQTAYAGDFDGNGLMDLVSTNASFQTYVLFMNGQ